MRLELTGGSQIIITISAPSILFPTERQSKKERKKKREKEERGKEKPGRDLKKEEEGI